MDTYQYRYFILFEDIRKKVFFFRLIGLGTSPIYLQQGRVGNQNACTTKILCLHERNQIYIFFSFWSCKAGRISNVKSIWFKQCVKKYNFLKFNHKANMMFIFLCLGLPRLMFKHFSFPNGISQTIKLICCVCVTLS